MCLTLYGLRATLNHIHRFPHQAHIGGDAKIPTVIYYNREGQIQAMGAETTIDSTQDSADQEQWHKAEWCAVLGRVTILMFRYLNSQVQIALPP